MQGVINAICPTCGLRGKSGEERQGGTEYSCDNGHKWVRGSDDPMTLSPKHTVIRHSGKIDESKLLPGEEKIARGEALAMAKEIIGMLGVKFVDPDTVDTETEYVGGVGIPVGSIRRKRQEVGDVDILVTAPIDKAALRASDRVTDMSGGDKQVNFTYDDGKNVRRVNLFSFTDPNTFGAALLHTTGPGGYNKRIRVVVPSRGFEKLSQNGLVGKDGKVLPGRTEAEVQRTLRITQREPDQRDSSAKPKKASEAAAVPRRLPLLEDYIHYSQHASQLARGFSDSVKDIAMSGSQDRRDIVMRYVDSIKSLVVGKEEIGKALIDAFSSEFSKYDVDIEDAMREQRWKEIADAISRMGSSANRDLEEFLATVPGEE